MNFDLRNWIDQILAAPARTKLVVMLSLAAVLAAAGVGSWVSSSPHFVTLYSELSDAERVAVEKALAGASVRYRVSEFPGPFVVYVDQAQYDDAQIAVALAEALKRAPKGIDAANEGAQSIFMSSGERQQSMQKREWQEAEQLLEHLDFVTDATVTTSMPDSSPLRAKRPVMVSVTLQLKNATSLTTEQAGNVAKLVQYRFGVPPENLVVTDQAGHTLYDPSLIGDDKKNVKDLLEHAAEYDREVASKANEHIAAAFGPQKALVTVTSQWNYDQSTVVQDTVDPETVATEIDTKTSQTPTGAANGVGGAAGVASNVSNADFGNDSAAVPGSGSGGSGGMSITKDERKSFETSRTRTQTVRTVPKLERLSVSLVLDESLNAKRDEIQRIVEAAVGFDKTRQDSIGVTVTNFAAATPPADTKSETGAPAEAPKEEGLSPMVEMLLQRGVEIVSALAFLFLLFTSLKGGKKKSADATSTSSGGITLSGGGGVGGDDSAPIHVDPEALARAQIEELVRTDPRRVGEILSRWVDEKSPAKV